MNSTSQAPEIRSKVGESGPDEGALLTVLRASERLEQRLEAALVAVGLSISKFDAMEQLISCDEPLTLGDLAGRLRCVRSNITQLVDRLESEGLVKRGSCPQDRRAVRAMLTPLGVERHAAGVIAIRAVQAEVAEQLSASDRKQLTRLLLALVG
jgi:DNA-binding MarR family transcriptional regulator